MVDPNNQKVIDFNAKTLRLFDLMRLENPVAEQAWSMVSKMQLLCPASSFHALRRLLVI